MKQGDCVCLKAGGYLMTIATVCGEAICCMWFEGERLYEGSFRAGDLQRWQVAE
jgi:uncharacterized protein YodC (DUF2158 family)